MLSGPHHHHHGHHGGFGSRSWYGGPWYDNAVDVVPVQTGPPTVGQWLDNLPPVVLYGGLALIAFLLLKGR